MLNIFIMNCRQCTNIFSSSIIIIIKRTKPLSRLKMSVDCSFSPSQGAETSKAIESTLSRMSDIVKSKASQTSLGSVKICSPNVSNFTGNISTKVVTPDNIPLIGAEKKSQTAAAIVSKAAKMASKIEEYSPVPVLVLASGRAAAAVWTVVTTSCTAVSVPTVGAAASSKESASPTTSAAVTSLV